MDKVYEIRYPVEAMKKLGLNPYCTWIRYMRAGTHVVKTNTPLS